MFAPSPRASKRQKIDPSRKGNIKNDEPAARRTPAAARKSGRLQPQIPDAIDDSRSDFIDSAYHSVGTSLDKAEHVVPATEEAAVTKERQTPAQQGPSTPIRGKKRQNVKGNKVDAEQLATIAASQIIKAPEDDGPKGSDSDSNDSSVVVVRTSGRTRTKTWKSAEVDTKNDSATARHASMRKTKEMSDVSSSPSTRNITKAASYATPRSAKDSTSASTKKNKLRMPSKYSGSAKAGKAAKQSELEAPTFAEIGHPDQTDNEELQVQDSDTPRVIKARTLLSTPRKAAPQSKKHKTTLNGLLAREEYHTMMTSMKEHILGYITATAPLPLCGEDHHIAYRKVYQILEQTVSAGEGNSMLLIGARGTAKTTLVNTAIQELHTELKDQFHTVRLNGFVHTDDKLALKEIWRQLGREMAVEDNSQADRGNYADTMASLLALLSQPEELLHGNGDRQTSKSVIFILDEFDLFTTHSRQTLLYNLFDIAQSKKAPIAVIGLTTRIDILESLEKRVKSRFSHRYTYVSHPLSFSAYMTIVRTFLLASAYDTEGEIDNQFIKSPALDELHLRFSTRLHEMRRAWSSYINQLLADQSILLLLNRHYSQTKSARAFLNAFLLPVMRLPTLPEPVDLLTNELASTDSNLAFLPSLPDASLALLISAARLDIVCDTETVTFNMAYDEYTRLAQRSRLTASASGMIAVSGSSSGGNKVGLSRDLALAAWERLEELGLLQPMAGQSGFNQIQSAGADLGRSGRLVRVDVGLEEIGNAPGLELGAMVKWCKEI